MPVLPSDTITLPLLPRNFARSSPKKVFQSRNLINITPIRSQGDIHQRSVVEIYHKLAEWQKILVWVAVGAVALFLISLLICLCRCCCRRRRVIKGKDRDLDSDAASTISHISGPLEVVAPRPMAGSPGDDHMVDVPLKTPAAPPGNRYGYGMFVNNQRNITGLAPPQNIATYGAPADSWRSPADRFGAGPSGSYMS